MVRIHEEFHTQKAADTYWRQYLKDFAPKIWGTVLRCFKNRNNGLWIVSGHRFVVIDEKVTIT